MSIIVTGAGGRIGSVTVDGLRKAGLSVVATDVKASEGVDFLGDLEDQHFVTELVRGAATIVHLAGHPNSREWPILDRLNIGVTRTLIEAAGRAGVERFVYASSVHAVGQLPADVRLHGDMPICPDGPYGVSKVMGETLLHEGCFRFGMSGLALRICAFRPTPGNARELRLWLSPGDMARLAVAGVTADFDDVRTIWGISANRRADVDRSAWAAIGYAPEDEAENFLPDLHAAGIDTEPVSEWPLLGGAFAAANLEAGPPRSARDGNPSATAEPQP